MFKNLPAKDLLKGKKVLLRADFNVPIANQKVSGANRIVESLGTLKYLISAGARVILISHLGRPKNYGDPESSLRPVYDFLKNKLDKIYFSEEIFGDITDEIIKNLANGEVVLLENLRWDAGEESGSLEFAKKLASLADIYVNDAFAVSHRDHASVSIICRFLPHFAGFLLEKEVTGLQKLAQNTLSPFVLVLGGAKIADKILVINNLAPHVSKILIGGAMANTFLAASGANVSNSLFEPEVLKTAKEYLDRYQDKIVLPQDNVKKEGEDGFSYMDIGRQTINNYKKIISEAKTIFWNGNMGYSEDQKYALGTEEIARAISNSSAESYVAGGDTVGAIEKMKIKDKFSFVSTGGGAALEFLAGKKLPGIKALED
jgi:phosphoglycerate kinase